MAERALQALHGVFDVYPQRVEWLSANVLVRDDRSKPQTDRMYSCRVAAFTQR